MTTARIDARFAALKAEGRLTASAAFSLEGAARAMAERDQAARHIAKHGLFAKNGSAVSPAVRVRPST